MIPTQNELTLIIRAFSWLDQFQYCQILLSLPVTQFMHQLLNCYCYYIIHRAETMPSYMKHPVNVSHEWNTRILSFLFPVIVIYLLLNVVSRDMQKDLTASLLYRAMSPRFNYPPYPLFPMPVPSSWVQLQRSAASSARYFYSFLLPLPKEKNKTTSAQTINISPPGLFVISLHSTLTTPAHQKKGNRGMRRWVSIPKANKQMQVV